MSTEATISPEASVLPSIGGQAQHSQKVLVSAYLIAAGPLLMYLLMCVWPVAGADGKTWKPELFVFGRQTPFMVSDDVRLLFLCMAAGALGSWVHASTSFVDYVGNRRFVTSWMLWYLMRPIIGSALALVLYVAIRGGLLTATAGSQNVSPYGVAAVAALAGMFSKQATDKLDEIFTTLFKTAAAGDSTRKDKLDSGPRVVSIEPAQLASGVDVEMKVNGAGFDPASIVRFNGQPKVTTFVSASQLTVKLTSADLSHPGSFALVVQNPLGQTSQPATVRVA